VQGKIQKIIEKIGKRGKFHAILIGEQWGTCFTGIGEAKENDMVETEIIQGNGNTNFKNIKIISKTEPQAQTQNPGLIGKETAIARAVALKAATEIICAITIPEAAPVVSIISEETMSIAEQFEKWLNR